MLFSENGERLIFANHNGKTEIVIDDGIKYVGIGVFDWASSVEKVIIKAKGLIAEPSSFSNMQNLKEIVFEDGGWIKEARGIESPFVGEGTADTSVQGSFLPRGDRKIRVSPRTDASGESVLYLLPASYRNHSARHTELTGDTALSTTMKTVRCLQSKW